MSPEKMQRDIKAARIATALDLANFSATETDGLRTSEEIATECRALSQAMEAEGAPESPAKIALDCANALAGLSGLFLAAKYRLDADEAGA